MLQQRKKVAPERHGTISSSGRHTNSLFEIIAECDLEQGNNEHLEPKPITTINYENIHRAVEYSFSMYATTDDCLEQSMI